MWKRKPGFIYWPVDNPGIFSDCHVGKIIAIDNAPPWIVIHNNPHDIPITNWPGHLWQAKVLKSIRPQGHTGNYIRCTKVEMIKELPLASLFERNGEAIEKMLATANRVSADQAEKLARSRHPDADSVYSSIWKAWLNIQDETSDATEYCGVLSVGGRLSGSPVGNALLIMHQVVFNRALAVVGESAAEDDEEDGSSLVEPWATCAQAFGDAVLAIGSPDIVDDESKRVLLHAWNSVF